jgi:SAM-dependent methyltransferase
MPDDGAFYTATYGNFTAACLRQVRAETYGGEDIGQNGWLTAAEFRCFSGWLGIDAGSVVLDVGSGSGGPALFMARELGCRVTGVDRDEHGVAAANEQAQRDGLDGRAWFLAADASKPVLEFPAGAFTAVMCIDAITHLPGRGHVLEDWHRLLAPGGRILYTDPVVLTGLVSSEEIAARSSIGYTEFAAPGEDERLIAAAGFELLHREDATANIAAVSGRWHAARARHRTGLVQIEGETGFEEMQAGMATVHRLSSERRLSRIVFVGEKRQ